MISFGTKGNTEPIVFIFTSKLYSFLQKME